MMYVPAKADLYFYYVQRTASTADNLPSRMPVMTPDMRFKILHSIAEKDECTTENELKQLLQEKPTPICYDGFEPSGRMHIAQVGPHSCASHYPWFANIFVQCKLFLKNLNANLLDSFCGNICLWHNNMSLFSGGWKGNKYWQDAWSWMQSENLDSRLVCYAQQQDGRESKTNPNCWTLHDWDLESTWHELERGGIPLGLGRNW